MGDHLSSRADVSRLFGRAAFGATRADLDTWEGRPYADAVEHLLSTPLGGARSYDRVLATLTTSPREGQLWWLNKMLTTPYPLEERMTLFWHNHFATAVGKVRGDELVVQNGTLRRHALGNVRDLLSAMTVDPAMLKWLDGSTNVVGAPNENYAREFFELFTLGARPRTYTEADVREAARAFTGWTTNGLIGELQLRQFHPGQHDTGDKVILGQVVTDGGADEHQRVVDIALAQPTAPKFIAYKLVQNFAYQPTTANLLTDPDPLVDEVAAALVANGWDIRSGVRALLMSDRFRYPDPTGGRQIVRQPIEIAVHAAKVLNIPAIADIGIIDVLRHAGQAPFEPPHVGGWPLGSAWLNPAAYLGLYAACSRHVLVRNVLDPLHLFRPPPPSADIASGGQEWAAAMGLAALSPNTVSVVRSYLDSADAGNEIQRQDGIFLLIANSPDWQVM